MLVEKAYRPRALTCAATDPLQVVARKMTTENVGALAVLDGDLIVGIVSERDLTRALAVEANLHEVTATTYASHEVKTAKLTDDTTDVARSMLDAGIRHVPVVHDNIVVGVISMRDLLAVETWL